MAQINITLNQEEILQILADDKGEGFRKLLEASLNEILKAESTEQLGAEPYERTENRTDSRNGTRERELTTRIGTITLKVPRHREVPFKTMIFENYSRSEAALISTMAEMVVNGVSTRKVANIMEVLCGTTYSKSAVSEVCRTLDEEVMKFRNRPLDKKYPFVIVDATYFKVRTEHRVSSRALMAAPGYTDKGKREIIGFDVYDNESRRTWTDFMESLKDRGLSGIKMITSDAHEGILAAISSTFPDVPWQRCQFHFTRNIIDSMPAKYQEGIKGELQDMFNSKTIEEARKKRDEIINEYNDIAEKAMNCLDEGFEEAMTVMYIPEKMRRSFRTSNAVERLNRELKRRSKVIGIFPNVESVLRLMGAVLMEENDKIQATDYSIFYQPAYEELCNSESKLKETAREQRALLAA